jgi:hypothetical protein
MLNRFLGGFVKPMENGANTACGKGNTRIRRAIVHVNSIAVGSNGHAARKDHVVHIAAPLVRFFRPKNPLLTAFQAPFRAMQVKQR